MAIYGVFISLNHATIVKTRYLSANRCYHDYANLPIMALPLFALQLAENAMKNTIDDAEYVVD